MAARRLGKRSIAQVVKQQAEGKQNGALGRWQGKPKQN
jgi:hypothetical protein